MQHVFCHIFATVALVYCAGAICSLLCRPARPDQSANYEVSAAHVVLCKSHDAAFM